MPLLAKDDQGVRTGVCHDRIELRDSVDDDKADPDEAWRMLVKALVMLFAPSESRPEDQGEWLQVTSIDRTCYPAPFCRGDCGF